MGDFDYVALLNVSASVVGMWGEQNNEHDGQF